MTQLFLFKWVIPWYDSCQCCIKFSVSVLCFLGHSGLSKVSLRLFVTSFFHLLQVDTSVRRPSSRCTSVGSQFGYQLVFGLQHLKVLVSASLHTLRSQHLPLLASDHALSLPTFAGLLPVASSVCRLAKLTLDSRSSLLRVTSAQNCVQPPTSSSLSLITTLSVPLLAYPTQWDWLTNWAGRIVGAFLPTSAATSCTVVLASLPIVKTFHRTVWVLGFQIVGVRSFRLFTTANLEGGPVSGCTSYAAVLSSAAATYLTQFAQHACFISLLEVIAIASQLALLSDKRLTQLGGVSVATLLMFASRSICCHTAKTQRLLL